MQNKTKIFILIAISLLVMLAYVFLGLNTDILAFSLGKRIPKLIVMVVIASVIAIATLLFQTITNNRLLTPSILGFESIYLFIQTSLVFFASSIGHFVPNDTVRFVLSTVIMIGFSLILYRIMFKNKQNIYLLLLVGTVIGTFFNSATGFLQKILDPNEFSLLQGNLFASFNNVKTNLVVIAIIIFLLTIPFIYDYFQSLDILLLGKEQSINLGVDYDKITRRIFVVVAVLISVSTALIGPLTFLGLIVVNLSYQLIKSYKHSTLMFGAIFISIICVVGGQLLIERVFDFNATLSVMINFIGGIYFMYLLIKERTA